MRKLSIATIRRILANVFAYIHVFSSIVGTTLLVIPLILLHSALFEDGPWYPMVNGLLLCSPAWVISGISRFIFRCLDSIVRPWKQMLEESGDQYS